MIKILNCRKKNYLKNLNSFLEKRKISKNLNIKVVRNIIKDIKINGTAALLKYEKKFSNNSEIKPSKKKILKSIKSLDPKVKKSLDFAFNRILRFHKKQKINNIKFKDNFNNKIEQKYIPLDSLLIYVPSNLPSTLLMTGIPAKIAGIKKIILASPKFKNKLNPAVLYVAKKLKILDKIYSIGGSQAIAYGAYVLKVNKIVGPGNNFVSTAKKEVFGDVGIDMIAGPSEITIIADEFSNPDWVAADLLAQAEHDTNSQSILITKNKNFINKVKISLSSQLKVLPKKFIARKSLNLNGIFIHAFSDKQIVDIVNTIAPEHLELNVKNYNKFIKKITNAGSICLGRYSAMAVTDYNAGSNHILPTNSSAKFSSGLSVYDFYKRISYINLSKKGIESIGEQVINLASYEGLEGHAKSVKLRIRRK